jgi:hypothetical protein
MFGFEVKVPLDGRFKTYPKEIQAYILECNNLNLDFSVGLAKWKAKLVIPQDLDKAVMIVFKNKSCYNKFLLHYTEHQYG